MPSDNYPLERNSSVNEANADVMRRRFAYMMAGDMDAVVDDMAAPYELKIPGVSDEVIVGETAIEEAGKTLFAAFSPLEIEIQSIYADDTTGCAELLVGGVQVGEFDGIPASGKRIVQSVCAFYTFRDGKIVGETTYADRRELLRQVGYMATISPAAN
jgi:steroid delta-isomerase-like uncharacterized protein